MAESEPIDVLLYGLGAIGSFYAFILSRADRVRLTVVARSNYDAVVKDGIKITSANHGEHSFRPDRVIRTPSEATGTKFAYIVCAHKAVDPAGSITPLDPVISDETTIVVLQNGVGNEDPFRERWPGVTVISGVVWVGASQPTPGVIVHNTSEMTELGIYPNPSLSPSLEQSRLEGFTTLLSSGGTHHRVHSDIQPRRWEKVVWNVAWNAITALTDQDVGSWLHSSPEAIPYSKRLMNEVIAVAGAVGVQLEEGLADTLIERAMGLGNIRTSMQTDRECGRLMEIEVILGVPVRKGREMGVDTPLLEGLYVLLLAINKNLGERK
ncbi:ketopantoate reductase family protein [Aspergillus stella-maris]|uniref:ketopantoate reductase family protein n=1 Tax=Aspergillus stella-maris TaxID=1810926 RepID=UPI003CCCE2A1